MTPSPTNTSQTGRDTGGPAFPAYMKESAAFGQDFCQEGMTLLDWFAGQALAGITVNLPPDIGLDLANGIRGGKNISAAAYALADAMIAERNK